MYYTALVLAGLFALFFVIEQVVVAIAASIVEIDALVSITTIGPFVDKGSTGSQFSELLAADSCRKYVNKYGISLA